MPKYCLALFVLFFTFAQISQAKLYPDVEFPPNTIRPPTQKGYSITINIPQRTLYLFYQGKLRKTYPVAVGKSTSPTPVGRMKIVNKVVDPTWYPKGKDPVPQGPDNPLGRRWLGLSIPGYGIHGNNNPASIGTAISLGCIRMHNKDVEELFQLVSVGTLVDIIYETVILQERSGDLYVTLAEDLYKRKPPDLEQALKGLPVSSLALPLIQKSGGPVPWRLDLDLNGERWEGIYWNGEAFLPLAPFCRAFDWQQQDFEIVLPSGEIVASDLVAKGNLYLKWERLLKLLEGLGGLSWQEEGLKLKIIWQEGATPPVLIRKFP